LSHQAAQAISHSVLLPFDALVDGKLGEGELNSPLHLYHPVSLAFGDESASIPLIPKLLLNIAKITPMTLPLR